MDVVNVEGIIDGGKTEHEHWRNYLFDLLGKAYELQWNNDPDASTSASEEALFLNTMRETSQEWQMGNSKERMKQVPVLVQIEWPTVEYSIYGD